MSEHPVTAEEHLSRGNSLPAPLPEGLSLEPKGDVTVIVSVPTYAYQNGVTWKMLLENLSVYSELGIDTMALWPIWKHIPRIEAIRARIARGEVELKLNPHMPWWTPKDYLKINPELGSEEEFSKVVEKAHRLGIKMVPVLQVSYALPGGYVYENHPEWIIKSIYGEYAVLWPWARCPWGYVLDKSDPGLIDFVTETVLPHWIEDWGVDGVWLDSPPVWACDSRVREACKGVKYAEGCGCLTPVEGVYSTEPLAEAMRNKIRGLEKKVGRKLVCAGENSLAGYSDIPEEFLRGLAERKPGVEAEALFDPRVKGSLAKYWDWVCDYRFRLVLMSVHKGEKYSYSGNYVEFFDLESKLMDKETDPARLVNMLNNFMEFRCLHLSDTAECYITLAATAPGKTLWVAGHHVGETRAKLPERRTLEAWYKRLIRLKRAYPALQSRSIEDALVKPRAPGLIAYNRWMNDQSITVAVNAGKQHHKVNLKTRFQGRSVRLIDLLHGSKIDGDPGNLRVEMPPYTARVLAEYKG